MGQPCFSNKVPAENPPLQVFFPLVSWGKILYLSHMGSFGEFSPKKPVTAALLGAGARGELNLGTLARRHPDKIRFVAVAEPDKLRRDRFASIFGIPKENAFADWRDLAAREQIAGAVVNALPCDLHYDSTVATLAKGYHVLLEKPMAHVPAECVKLVEAARDADRLLMISLQCRYNDIYLTMRKWLDGGDIGKVMNVDCAENMGYWHFLMSYVRGIHHRSKISHSSMMAKAIHDIDLIQWFAGSRARRVSSFGSLKFFKEENAPRDSTENCFDCPHKTACEFSGYVQYVSPGKPDIPLRMFRGMSFGALYDYVMNPRLRSLGSVVMPGIEPEDRRRLIKDTIYARCAFRCDNDVVDHQTVSIEYDDGITVSFSLSAFSLIWERTLNLHGTKGEIRSADFTGKLEMRTYNPARVTKKSIPYHGMFHGGGDERLIVHFADALQQGKWKNTLVRAENCLESHLICLAAEESRVQNRVVDMEEFRKRAIQEAKTL